MVEREDPIPEGPDDCRIKGWDLVAQRKLTPKRFVDSFPKGERISVPGIPRDRVYLRIEGDRRQVEPALLKKVKKKLRQTSGDPSLPPRLIMVEFEGRFQDVRWPLIHEKLGRLFRSHSRFAGVWFWGRRYSSGRYLYEQWLHSNDAGGYAFPEHLLAKLNDLERAFVY